MLLSQRRLLSSSWPDADSMPPQLRGEWQSNVLIGCCVIRVISLVRGLITSVVTAGLEALQKLDIYVSLVAAGARCHLGDNLETKCRKSCMFPGTKQTTSYLCGVRRSSIDGMQVSVLDWCGCIAGL